MAGREGYGGVLGCWAASNNRHTAQEANGNQINGLRPLGLVLGRLGLVWQGGVPRRSKGIGPIAIPNIAPHGHAPGWRSACGVGCAGAPLEL